MYQNTRTGPGGANREALFDVYARSSLQVPMCYTLTAVKG
jgi:hypothetical protein